MGPICLLGIALWLGLIVGPAELLLTRVQKPLTDPSPGLFRMNRHIMWTVPIVDLVVFGLCGLIMAVLLRVWPRLGIRAAVGPLLFLTTLTLLLSCRWLHVLACLVIAFLITFALIVRIEASFPTFRRLVLLTLPVMAVLVAAWIGWSLGEEIPGAHLSASSPAAVMKAGHDAPAPNVLLVVLDTVRADHLSLHGYDRDTSPNLLKLARRGITFQQARSTAPWTLPSHASMMTGRWPHELSTGINYPLDGTYPTLSEYLGPRGYATAAFVGNTAYCGFETGLGRGFAHFEDHVMSLADILWTSALGQRIFCSGSCSVQSDAPVERRTTTTARMQARFAATCSPGSKARRVGHSLHFLIFTTPTTRTCHRAALTVTSVSGPGPPRTLRFWNAGSSRTRRSSHRGKSRLFSMLTTMALRTSTSKSAGSSTIWIRSACLTVRW